MIQLLGIAYVIGSTSCVPLVNIKLLVAVGVNLASAGRLALVVMM